MWKGKCFNVKAKVKDLIPDSKNYNKGNEYGESLIAKSFQKFGAGRSILLDKNGKVIAGNKSLQKFAEQGGKDVTIVESDGKKLIAVKRTDIDLDTPEGREMALADNATAKANIEWDIPQLEMAIAEFDLKPLDWGVKMPHEVSEDDYVIPDEIETDIVTGDLFEIGQHRLLCGDSTKADDVEKAMGKCKPILMVTDPPYGVNYDPTWRHKAGIINSGRQGKVTNDEKVDWTQTYALFSGDVTYVWHGGRHAAEVAYNLNEAGYEIVCQIVWNKQQIVMSRGDYHWKHEPCWYAVRKGSKHNWQGSRKEATVWDITSILQSKESGDDANFHGTQKPVECMARPIRNNSYERETVYDPFLGSGTTMVAGHQLNRKVIGIEISPTYCQIILERMLKLDPSLEIKRNGKAYSLKDKNNESTVNESESKTGKLEKVSKRQKRKPQRTPKAA